MCLKHLHRTIEDICMQCKKKLHQCLDLLTTRGTAEQCGDCYKQTDMAVNSALNDITHLGYFHL